jgi:phospholipid N-methyltransferase
MSVGTFLAAALRRPGIVGAVAPSSRHLAAQMVASAALAPGQLVVELGAGTGPMTRALVAAHPSFPRFALEPDPAMAAVTRAAAPGVEVIEAYAQDLPALLAERGLGPIDRVVSSLPFAVWPPSLQDAVFSGILEAMAPDGRLVTFTYVQSPYVPAGRRARATLEKHFARVSTSPVVWCNLPPAFVYVCDRSPSGPSRPA